MRLFRYFLLLLTLTIAADTLTAQTTKWREMHKVKRKETIFSIAQQYGLTVDELANANPEMRNDYYKLKKGDYIFIPYPTAATTAKTATTKATATTTKSDVRNREVRVGVMLPLHNINGDGRRMVEYYRGVLMACDSLKQGGTSVDIAAWNVPEGADIKQTLKEKKAAGCDLIIGPLYSTQVKDLSDFAAKHDVKVLIPFSINAPEVETNQHLFQVYQNSNDYNDAVISRFMERFNGYHVVLIDCNDTTSRKGVFTFPLRKRLESKGIQYSITNLKSSEAYFRKAFSTSKPNVVILNTGRSPELNVAFAKLDNLTMENASISVTLFGYTEWMMYTKYNLDKYYKYNVHIPGTFYMNPLSPRTARIEQKYRWNFHADMQQALPRFAITGFDQAYYFIKGLKMYGSHFTGATGTVGYTPIQTPLRFERAGNGGYKNRSIVFVHYTTNHRTETLYY